MLHVNHRVAAGQRSAQHGVIVLRRGRADHHHAWQVGKPAFERLRVLCGRRVPDADGHAHHHRHAALAAKHEAVFGGLVDDLVHAAQRKINHAHLDHRAQTGQRHANASAQDGGLADGCVDHALSAEARLQALVLAEDAAAAHVLTNHHHVGVGRHLMRQSQGGGFGVSHQRH